MGIFFVAGLMVCNDGGSNTKHMARWKLEFKVSKLFSGSSRVPKLAGASSLNYKLFSPLRMHK